MIEGNKKRGIAGSIIAFILALLGYQATPDHFTNFLLPNEQVFNKKIDSALAQAYADTHGYELLDCIDEIGWCRFRGHLSLYFNSLTDDLEHDGEIGIFPPIEGQGLGTSNIDTEATFNDPEYDTQWNLFAAGFDTVLAQGTTCSPDIKVVIIDTGLWQWHNDLAVPSNCYHTYPNTCLDGNGHGTHVLGTGAMLVDNNLGGAGATPGCDWKTIKALSDGGTGNFFDVANALIAAVDLFDADVINMSIGSDIDTPTVLADALDYVEANGRNGLGSVVVAAAGNSSLTSCATPARHPTVLCVGAMDETGNIAYFSNRGQYLDLVAPGTDILSTIPNNGWSRWNGTSMASPHVAVAAAMYMSNDPGAASMTAAQIRDHVRNTTRETPNCTECASGQLAMDLMLGNLPAPTPTPSPTLPLPTLTPTATATAVVPSPTPPEPNECTITVNDYPQNHASTWDAWNLVATNNQLNLSTFMVYMQVQTNPIRHILQVKADDQALCDAWKFIFESEGYVVTP